MLPTIETPKHTLTLPISGKKIEFRPFLMKEQKVLLQAIEMGDESQLQNAIKDITSACTYNTVEIDKLPIGDVEFLFINLRMKSIGESVELLYKCNKCEAITPLEVKLSDIKIQELQDDKIILEDSIGVIMQPLTYGMVKKASEEKTDVDKAYRIILDSIKLVFDEDQTYTDFTDVELFEFLEKLSASNFDKIEKYTESQPTITKKIQVKCRNCGNEQEIELKGLSDFLG